MMRCDNCGGKHKRIPVDRPWYSARFCDRCSIRHSAKEVRDPVQRQIRHFFVDFFFFQLKITDIFLISA